MFRNQRKSYRRFRIRNQRWRNNYHIENPNAGNDRHLVVVRDSFGSALLPLLAQSYAKVTAVDIRYMMPNLVGNFVDFTDADVLFLYSSTVLNNSITLK